MFFNNTNLERPDVLLDEGIMFKVSPNPGLNFLKLAFEQPGPGKIVLACTFKKNKFEDYGKALLYYFGANGDFWLFCGACSLFGISQILAAGDLLKIRKM